MKIIVLQPEYPVSDASLCLKWISTQLDALSVGEQELVLLPEYTNTPGIEEPNKLRALAEANGAEFLQHVSTAAKRLHCLIATGAVVRDGDLWFNRTLIFDATGEVVFHYDKIHLTTTESRDLGLTAGTTSPIFEYPGSSWSSGGTTSVSSGLQTKVTQQLADDAEVVPPPDKAAVYDRPIRIGFATCFDLYFPEHFVALAAQNVDLILCPSYQRSESAERIRIISQMRALDSGAYLIRSSYAMPTPDRGGHSLIASPEGTLLADAGNTAGSLHAEFDPAQKFTKPASHGQPPVEHRALIESHRRPETYRAT